MSAQNTATLKLAEPAAPQKQKRPLKERLDDLKSKELVISFSGPIGSGLKDVIDVLTSKLTELNYTVVPLKLSGLIIKHAPLENEADRAALASLKGADRYTRLQTLGNALRRERGPD